MPLLFSLANFNNLLSKLNAFTLCYGHRKEMIHSTDVNILHFSHPKMNWRIEVLLK
jgi:hypothetical protein